jgi:RNA polymerase sigma-70 factor (ECF subfamily)
VDDIELLDKWCAGDRVAGDQLLKRYYRTLYRFFANKISSDVDDLVQQTVAALITGRDRFERRSTFRAYLLSIARYQLYEYVRNKRRASSVIEYDAVSAFDLSPSPSILVAEHHKQQLLLEALRRIPLNFQVALELHYWEELSGPELAEVLNVPVDTAYSRVRKGRVLVRKQLRILGSNTGSKDSRAAIESYRPDIPGNSGSLSSAREE